MFVLDTNVSKLLKKYKLKLEFAPLHCPGLIVHGKNGKPDVIVVNSKLNDDQVENVILHEIGHAKNDGDVLGDYQTNDSARSCSEHGANVFGIHEKIKQYFALGNDLDSANWLSIANALGTTDYFQVQEEIHKYALLEE